MHPLLLEESLRSRTSTAWAAAALAHPLELLDDHAHLERKAAANALALLRRWPREGDAAGGAIWVRVLGGVARDESEHLALVLGILERRGRGLGRVHRNPYAAALRALVRRGRGPEELVDRLLVSAVIEARSAERFEALAAVAEDDELRRLYRGLRASEKGHTVDFLDLAVRLPGTHDVPSRWRSLLEAEARILAAESPGPRMHSGEPRG